MARYSTKQKPKQPSNKNAFPIWLVLLGLALVALAAIGLWAGNRPSGDSLVKGAPGLKVDQEVIDHGDVKLGTPVKDVVRVTNVGDKLLTFTQKPYIQVLEGC